MNVHAPRHSVAEYGPDPVDVHVGMVIRQLRKRRGLSQEKLAEGLSLTFQQVQKYERGTNRISMSKIWRVCAILGVEIGVFFEGLPGAVSPPAGEPVSGLKRITIRPESARFYDSYEQLPKLQREFVQTVIEALAAKKDRPADVPGEPG